MGDDRYVRRIAIADDRGMGLYVDECCNVGSCRSVPGHVGSHHMEDHKERSHPVSGKAGEIDWPATFGTYAADHHGIGAHLVEQIATYIQDDGADSQRMALADGVRTTFLVRDTSVRLREVCEDANIFARYPPVLCQCTGCERSELASTGRNIQNTLVFLECRSCGCARVAPIRPHLTATDADRKRTVIAEAVRIHDSLQVGTLSYIDGKNAQEIIDVLSNCIRELSP